MTSKKNRRRTQVIIIVVAAAVVASIVAVIPWGGSSNKPKALPSLVPGELLDSGGTALATLLTDARNHTFHARYVVHGDTRLIGGTLQLEWWNTKSHSRIDTTRTRGGEVVRTVSIVNGTNGIGCQRVGSGAWTCKPISVPAPGDPGGIVTNLTAQLSGRQVTEYDRKVGGRAARCFHVGAAPSEEPIDVCTNPDGVILYNASPNVSYNLTTLDTAVPAAIFDPPVPVSH